jgi:hypothetical protein
MHTKYKSENMKPLLLECICRLEYSNKMDVKENGLEFGPDGSASG